MEYNWNKCSKCEQWDKWNKFDKCDKCDKKKKEICYYKCKDQGQDCKKCKKYIEKTEELIKDIKHENNDLENNAGLAATNQLAAQNSLTGVYSAIDDLTAAVTALKAGLDDVINGLAALKTFVNNNTDTPQQAAIANIADVQTNQQNIDKLVNHLECSFDKTVKCLKDRKCSHPILVPIEDEKPCYKKHDDERPGWDYDEDNEYDEDWGYED